MSIIITGLEMPTERESFNLTIKYNGTVLDTETGMQVAEAYELPPHGRLIDADAVLRRYDYELSRTYTDDFAKGFQLGVKAAVGNGAAVIIPTEEGE